eukprot:COSAG01_NODE_33510_length_563_cov_0.655172_2_plen_100_part_01
MEGGELVRVLMALVRAARPELAQGGRDLAEQALWALCNLVAAGEGQCGHRRPAHQLNPPLGSAPASVERVSVERVSVERVSVERPSALPRARRLTVGSGD